jgi:hypothetical protein
LWIKKGGFVDDVDNICGKQAAKGIDLWISVWIMCLSPLSQRGL